MLDLARGWLADSGHALPPAIRSGSTACPRGRGGAWCAERPARSVAVDSRALPGGVGRRLMRPTWRDRGARSGRRSGQPVVGTTGRPLRRPLRQPLRALGRVGWSGDSEPPSVSADHQSGRDGGHPFAATGQAEPVRRRPADRYRRTGCLAQRRLRLGPPGSRPSGGSRPPGPRRCRSPTRRRGPAAPPRRGAWRRRHPHTRAGWFRSGRRGRRSPRRRTARRRRRAPRRRRRSGRRGRARPASSSPASHIARSLPAGARACTSTPIPVRGRSGVIVPQSIGPRCSRCGAAWATGLTTSRSMLTCCGSPTQKATHSATSAAVRGRSTPS